MSSVFTRIIDGELPGRFVWRDERVVAFIPIGLLAPGHTLVVPIEEVDHWIDVDRDLNAHLWGVAQTIARVLDEVYRPSKVGVLVVGEEVPHTHIHLVPYTSLAQLNFANQDTSPSPEALDEQMARTREALRAAGHGAAVPG